MTDDTAILCKNNTRASALFYDLLDRAERGAYDGDFLTQLAAYRTEGSAEHADIFAAEYLCANGDAEGAIVCA